MGVGISAVATFAIGVAISPLPIMAVILMLFSRQARVNGPLFVIGWALALALVSGISYVLADTAGASTDSVVADTVGWGKIAIGVLFLGLALRSVSNRPAPGAEVALPKWMASVDSLQPAKAFGLALLLGGLNPKNLLLSIGAAASLAALGLPGTDVLVSLIVFVALGSVTIAAPVAYYLLGGAGARLRLDSLKGWLGVHNAAVMAVLFLVLGVTMVGQGLAPLLS
jgi:hypothetical protein